MQRLNFLNFNRYFPVALLLLLLSQGKNAVSLQGSSNIKKTTSVKDTISINFENITVLNFSDYFSKIEIVPLDTLNDINNARFDRQAPKYVATLDGLSYTLDVNAKTGDFIIRQYPWPLTAYFDKTGRLKYFNIHFFEDDSVSIPDNIFLSYKNKTVLPEAPWKIEWMDYITRVSDNQYVFPEEIYQSNRYIFVVTDCMERTYYSFHDKQTNQTKTGIDLFSNGILLPNVRVMSKGILYGMVSPWDLNSAIDTAFLTDESKKRLSEIKMDDNSIIVKYYAK